MPETAEIRLSVVLRYPSSGVPCASLELGPFKGTSGAERPVDQGRLVVVRSEVRVPLRRCDVAMTHPLLQLCKLQ